MPRAAHVVFARDQAANVAAASDFFAVNRSEFYCVVCAKPMRRTAPKAGFPYFVHAQRSTCRLAAHYALRAAAQHVLRESRFVKVPARVEGTNRVHSLLLQWTDCIADIEVVHLPVDFLTETTDGQVIIEFAIPGLPRAVSRERLERLKVPTLEIVLPDPTQVRGWADLRQHLLHGIDNKSWIYPLTKDQGPVQALPKAEWHAPPGAAQGIRPGTTSAWTSPLAFADNAFYRQMGRAEQLEVLQEQMGKPVSQWPDTVNIEVRGEGAFGVDRRAWQADVYGRWILRPAASATVPEVAFADVYDYLLERYHVEERDEPHARIAAFYYLQGLVEHGLLVPLVEDIDEPTYLVVHGTSQRSAHGLIWNAKPTLSASQLRFLSVQAGLHIPIDMVGELLDSFDECHPAVPVLDYAAILSRRLHALPRSVIAFLLDAGLASEGAPPVTPTTQQNLF